MLYACLHEYVSLYLFYLHDLRSYTMYISLYLHYVVSSLNRNGYSCLRTSKNKSIILGGAITLKFQPLLIMHTTTIYFVNSFLYVHCYTKHITIHKQTHAHFPHYHRHLFQFETNTAIKTNSNKDYTSSEKRALPDKGGWRG
jgi:hypothetical protein